jgi:hypothetical protein
MKSTLIVFALIMVSAAQATSVPPMKLPEMMALADHVLVATVTKVDMVNAKGHQITRSSASTGPGQKNVIRLHLEVKEVLLTNAQPPPREVVVPLWSMWHYTLGQIQQQVTGSGGIFLLRGEQFHPAHPAAFQRGLDERAEIDALLAARASAGSSDALRMAAAERFIDAFYSFDPSRLREVMKQAPGSQAELVFYQGWAQGGNYKTVKRGTCAVREANKIACPVTVEDDLIKALGIDFHVTDTFVIGFHGVTLVEVNTESDDPEAYHAAKKWVRKNRPEVFKGPCLGYFAGGPTPGDCVRAMVKGYREFKQAQ